MGWVVPQAESLALEPVPTACPLARQALRRAIALTPVADRVDDGELAVAELVSNAVLHGREPLVLALLPLQDGLRVAVRDRCPVSPSFGVLDPTAVTGRGLLLVSAVTDRWGVDPLPHGKSVWFELYEGAAEQAGSAQADALLAAWGEELLEDPAHERVCVVLPDLDVALLARSEAGVDGLLRELALLCAAADTGDGDTAGAGAGARRQVAQRVVTAGAQTGAVRSELRRQLNVALTAGQPTIDVRLTLRRDDAEHIRDLLHALHDAGSLFKVLLAPVPAKHAAVSEDYLRRILAQLSG